MKAKPKKCAAESLVSETEKKTIISPKKQRELGVLTAEAVLGGGAGFLAKQVGKQVVKKVATRAADKKARKVAVEKTSKKKAEIKEKKSGEKILNAEFEDDLLRAYNKAHPRARKAKYTKAMETETSMLKRKYGAKVRKKLTDLGYKSKGGYVKKYAKGGGVRKVRF